MQAPEKTTDRNAFVLAGLRIAVGVFFLIFGQYKVFGTQFTLHGGFETWIHRFLESGSTYPFFAPVLERFVLLHATPIAFLVAYGELAIGLALVSGLCVRIASGFGLVFMVVLLLASNFPGSHVPLWQYFGASLDHSVFGLCFLCFIFGRSDERLSVRSLLAKRKA